ncbi:Cell wall beta-glucan synthesis [Penicillium concentricum]|uniref:Cell wall beta-glucan synthesis n=1 Tax=Penicillium concentricum TaxID=293559 RepID=A0A9W9STC4_9EURO|nr:Cell wall beta-glucan synthesis [Penicillium concentricum]KAJ5383775.1 Cell wall beta-glucan synthesis [Penicillium concentricum]
MRVNIISLVALAATTSALLVTSPRIGEKIDPDMPLTIKWQTVATDPDTFTIELVNQNVYPSTTSVVVEDIESSKGSYTVKAKTFTDVDDGKGYQINFISPTSGILAQSQQFRVTEPGAIASSSGKETSIALETSSVSLMSSTASTSDITSTPSSTASSYLSSTAHSSSNLGIYLDAYHTHFFISIFYLHTCHLFLSLFYIYTFNFFFHCNFFLHYIHLCYPNYFFFHYHVFYVTYSIHTFYLNFQIKHYLSYIPFFPYFHHPWLVKAESAASEAAFCFLPNYIEKTNPDSIYRIDLCFNHDLNLE